jgi:hypothetical protein
MKRSVLFSALLIGSVSGVVLSANAKVSLVQGLHDFFAPIVNSKTDLVNTVPAGSIVYENSNSTFFGLTPGGEWVSLGSTVAGPRSEIWVVGSPGGASTNTGIKRLSTVVKSTGTAVTYTDSSTAGAAFEINEDGIYAISYMDGSTTGPSNFGISLNASDLTSTGILALPNAQIAGIGSTASTNHRGSATFVGFLSEGDIVRPHSNGDPDSSNNASSDGMVRFYISKVSE